MPDRDARGALSDHPVNLAKFSQAVRAKLR